MNPRTYQTIAATTENKTISKPWKNNLINIWTWNIRTCRALPFLNETKQTGFFLQLYLEVSMVLPLETQAGLECIHDPYTSIQTRTFYRTIKFDVRENHK